MVISYLFLVANSIFRDYEDTKEAKKTIKIDTKKNIYYRSRNSDIESFQSQDVKSGIISDVLSI